MNNLPREKKEYMLDNIDKKILNTLLENSKTPIREIAKKAQVSVGTVINRIKMLEDNKIIHDYHIGIDYSRLDFDIEVMVSLKVANGKFHEVNKKLKNNPNICTIYDMTGSFDAIVVARFKKRRQLDEFIKKLQSIEHVKESHTQLILSIEHKKEMIM